ncbi:hypothetical protein HBI56_077180 [Parastagonospora nodorum]|uniref:Uncharacterized protein n=1 Tax=Phaeosphaeria nodorum (strain SN15 / ATCC MYA-4574 / FGSC 10173) TaxID=321614 RepID=A0A7U2HXQ3_PHANO|nr:hypothetical protein HBH56_150010 [Parastagonospora nodorum]QRC94229.1 hypothetical protein JI435_405430 [Parastagonospora nodorum SN15]KAH3928353.1 hypothetical protein HBH54_135910 [Parastagonospora nodorum]KAH3983630.1 hypothetical protein HBH52_062540 [Parastagonospora nodorum]KAH3985789.1 hypothetical protein HBH51_021330 [Parastagonospora nodorum]
MHIIPRPQSIMVGTSISVVSRKSICKTLHDTLASCFRTPSCETYRLRSHDMFEHYINGTGASCFTSSSFRQPWYRRNATCCSKQATSTSAQVTCKVTCSYLSVHVMHGHLD